MSVLPYAPDDPIEAYWPDDAQWLPATLLQACSDGTYRIAWDADGSESVVPGDFVRGRCEEVVVPADDSALRAGAPFDEPVEFQAAIEEPWREVGIPAFRDGGFVAEEERPSEGLLADFAGGPPAAPASFLAALPPPRQPLARLRGAQRDTRPAWMTKGLGIGTAILGEATGDLLKPGMTRADLQELERCGLQDGPDPFGDVFCQSSSGQHAMEKLAVDRGPPVVEEDFGFDAVGGLELEAPVAELEPTFEYVPEPTFDGPPRRMPPPPPPPPPRPQAAAAAEVAAAESAAAESSEPTFEHLAQHAFDGRPESALDFPHSEARNPSGNFSVDFWVQPRAGGSGYRSPVSSRDVPARGYAFFITPQGRWAFWAGTPEKNEWLKVDGPPVRMGEWQRLTGVCAASSKALRLFVDGEEYGSRRITSPVEANAQRPLRLGGGATEGPVKFPFCGDVCRLRIHAIALAEPLPENPLFDEVAADGEGDAFVEPLPEYPLVDEETVGATGDAFVEPLPEYPLVDEEAVGAEDDAFVEPLPEYPLVDEGAAEDEDEDEVYDVVEPPLKRMR